MPMRIERTRSEKPDTPAIRTSNGNARTLCLRLAMTLVAVTLVVGVFVVGVSRAGPYAPAAGQTGSTAVYMDDPAFVGWATGWQDYLVGTDSDPTWQTPEKALGTAAGNSLDVVGLGNGGRITLTFDRPITDGPGWDFGIFENSVSDTFLELAYVEVSSNGSDFFRFANDSLTAGPVSGFGTVDPTDVTGLAGKYRQGYATPFDLGELANVSPLLDVANVGFVRILDIIGDGSFLDSSGDSIFEPYPTVGSGGFDLDAVGVFSAVPVPEPTSGALLAFGAGAMLLAVGRRRPLGPLGPFGPFGPLGHATRNR